MDAIKNLLSPSRKSTVEKFSTRRSIISSPPPGKIVDAYDPNHEVWKPQHSTGDQSDESRIPFYNSGFKVCVRCGEQNIWRFEEKAGVRMNGDTYGTAVFLCRTKGCKWRTSFKYDDADPTCVHFEAKEWARGITMFPVKFMLIWCDKHELRELKRPLYKRRLDGDGFLKLYNSGQLQDTLHLSQNTMEKIRKVMKKPDNAVLARK